MAALALPFSLMSAPATAQGPTPSPSPTSTSAAPSSVPADPALKTAWDKATESGQPVEVPSKFTETMKVWANPDGKNMRAELYTRPVQLKNPTSGAWEPVDTRIITRDGKLQATRVKSPLIFGGRGTKQLVAATGKQGISGLGVTRALPEPKIDGSSVTYPDAIAPGVDLLVQAQADGFISQVVFRQRPTGPVTVRLPITLPEGTKFGKTSEGLPQLKNDKGKAAAAPIVLTAMDAKVEASPDEGKSSPVTARVETSGTTPELVFTPDDKFLADPAVTYPVTIAAASEWFGGGVPTDAWVNKNNPSTNNAAAGWLRAGTTSTSADIARVYLKFNTDAPELEGATVLDADLWMWNYKSGGPNGQLCGENLGNGIAAERVTSSWSTSSLSWSNQPLTLGTLEGGNKAGYNYEADPASWCAKEATLLHQVNAMTRAWIEQDKPNYGLVLRALPENASINWRQYYSSEYSGDPYPGYRHPPTLIVEYIPAPPAVQEEILMLSPTPLTGAPEHYENAVAQSIYQPTQPESVQITDALAQAISTQRDGDGYLVDTGKLDLDDGGDGSGEEDVTAPSVIAVEPGHGTVDVPLVTTVRATFSEKVADAKVVLKSAGGAEIAGSSALTDEQVLIFTPAAPLDPGVTYTATISGAIDAWENTMQPFSWSFSTMRQAAGHWNFDEGEGRTVADSSGNDHDATLNNTALWIAGKNSNAISNMPSQAQVAASQAAAKQGKAVEVADQTTATSITYAQPDGKTFKTEVTAGPVRTRQGAGWVPIDATLAEQGGKLRPKALAEGAVVEISAGGTDPFVKMSADGKSYALRWPTPLPKPTVKGSVATYTDAAGVGADLVVTALSTGFRYEVVLRQRPAKPLELRIGVDDEGLTLTEGKGGRLLLKGKDKKLLAAGTRPIVSDGSAKGPLAKRAEAGTDVVTKDGRTDLVVKPDQAFLADADTTYPVRVAAAVTLPVGADVDVSTLDVDAPSYPSSPNLMAGTMTGGMKMRVHLKFDTTGLQGSTVSDAKLSMNTVDSHSCGPTLANGIQVARLTSAWDPTGMYWATKPTLTTEDASTNFKGVNSDCATWPDSMEWNVTGVAQDWAAGAANHGLVLKSPGEANIDNYRVFTSSEDTDFNQPPTLTITTSGPASQPAVSAPAITPAHVVNGTTVTTSLTPQLAATVADPASGNLTGQFEVEHDPAATGQGTGQIWTGASQTVTSGGQATVSVPAGKLTDGWKIRWRARAANATASTTSAWSNWQTATVDVPNPTVSAFQVTPSQVVDGGMVATSLTPALRATVTDPAAQPVRAEFELEHEPTATGQGTGQIWAGTVDNVASGTQASATVPAGKLTDGWKVRWRVRAINTSTTVGSPWSDWQTLTIDVPDPVSEPSVGALQVSPSEQVDGATVTPTRTPVLLAQVLDPAGKPLRAEAEIEHDPAATGQGTGQIWTGSADNVPAGTQANVTIPADTLSDGLKVRWRARAVSPTAASAWSDWQSFTISLPKPTATALTITPSKVVDGVTVTATLTPTLQATLTHPTGQALRAEAEIEHDPAATDQGTGQIWTGAIDNVASGTPANITVPAGKLTDGWKVRWRLRAVTEQAPSAWSDWQQVTIDVTQPGEEPLAQTTGPVIRTDQNFTAAAWLRWSDKDGDYTVLEQKGTHQAPFRLGNTPDHGLVFTFTSADTADATVEGALSDVEPPVGEWFHLAGVYDATAKTASLYLNGNLVKTSPVSFTAWNADTAMTLGTKTLGDLDDVQLYQRPLSSEELTAVVNGPSVRALITQPATGSAPKAASSATAASSFNPDHLTLENCYNTPIEPKHAALLARIQERVYASCWSSYVSYTVYESDGDDDDPDRPRRRAGNRSPKLRGVLGMTLEEMQQKLSPDVIFQMRVTWVVHTYLGNASGNGVVNGEGTGVTPQSIKVFARLGEFGLYSEGRRLSAYDDKLEQAKIGFNVELESQAGRPCRIQSGSEQVRTIKTWQSNSDAAFVIDADTDAQLRSSVCTIKPMWSNVFGYPVTEGRLWSQEYLDEKGKRIGVIRKGDGAATGNLYAPHVRCDWRTSGREDDPANEVDDHTGGCVNTRGHKIFVMSKSQNANFRQVIDHIETALNTATNPRTHPAVRPSETQDPPLRTFDGTEQIKKVPGNWAADPGTVPGGPLTRNSTAGARLNRAVFSGRNFSFTAEGKYYRSNYCRYYYEDLYGDPAYIARVDPRWNELQCDEYPFASSQQGAANAAFDYSLRAIGREHNRLHGVALNKFYSKYRVVDVGDPYWVLIVS
ncbi:DNRLRE domain-containing protein [Nonomuraea muscovyensis]|uniref:DNRLRE domain-containing protein n=1 Tax=Nonomuraea muscovyensis TaxID=1124761 RepID=UPI0033DF0B29